MLSDGILKHFLYSFIILRLPCLSVLCLAGRFRLPCSKAGVLRSLFLLARSFSFSARSSRRFAIFAHFCS